MTKPLSREEIERLEKLAEGASPAPVGYEPSAQSDQYWEIASLDGRNRLDWAREIAMVVSSEGDTEYIVAMFNAVPTLCRQLLEAMDALKDVFGFMYCTRCYNAEADYHEQRECGKDCECRCHAIDKRAREILGENP